MDVKLPEIGPMPNFAVPQSIASTAGYVKLSAQMAPTVLAAAGRKGVDAIASKVEPYKYADVNFGSLKPTLPDSIVNSAIAKDARYLGTSAMMLPSTVGKAASSGLDEVTGFFGKEARAVGVAARVNTYKAGEAVKGAVDPYKDMLAAGVAKVKLPDAPEGLVGAGQKIGKGYRAAKTAEQMFRYKTDVRPGMIADKNAAERAAANVYKDRAKGKRQTPFDFGESGDVGVGSGGGAVAGGGSKAPLQTVNEFRFDQTLKEAGMSMKGTGGGSLSADGVMGLGRGSSAGRNKDEKTTDYIINYGSTPAGVDSAAKDFMATFVGAGSDSTSKSRTAGKLDVSGVERIADFTNNRVGERGRGKTDTRTGLGLDSLIGGKSGQRDKAIIDSLLGVDYKIGELVGPKSVPIEGTMPGLDTVTTPTYDIPTPTKTKTPLAGGGLRLPPMGGMFNTEKVGRSASVRKGLTIWKVYNPLTNKWE